MKKVKTLKILAILIGGVIAIPVPHTVKHLELINLVMK